MHPCKSIFDVILVIEYLYKLFELKEWKGLSDLSFLMYLAVLISEENRERLALLGNVVKKKENGKFTSKELDEETGLYYFGARYYDAQISKWISPDPIIASYLPVAPNSNEAKDHNRNLPGQGGVFNPLNLNSYHYAGNNPIKYIDPNGLATGFYNPFDLFRFFLGHSGTSGRFGELHLQAGEGNKNAQYMVKHLWITASLEAGILVFDTTSNVADGVAIACIAVGFAPGAAAAKKVSITADFGSLALKTIKAIYSGKTADWQEAGIQGLSMGAEFVIAGFIKKGFKNIRVTVGKNGYYYQLGRRGALKKWKAIKKQMLEDLIPQLGGEAAEEAVKAARKIYKYLKKTKK